MDVFKLALVVKRRPDQHLMAQLYVHRKIRQASPRSARRLLLSCATPPSTPIEPMIFNYIKTIDDYGKLDEEAEIIYRHPIEPTRLDQKNYFPDRRIKYKERGQSNFVRTPSEVELGPVRFKHLSMLQVVAKDNRKTSSTQQWVYDIYCVDENYQFIMNAQFEVLPPSAKICKKNAEEAAKPKKEEGPDDASSSK